MSDESNQFVFDGASIDRNKLPPTDASVPGTADHEITLDMSYSESDDLDDDLLWEDYEQREEV